MPPSLRPRQCNRSAPYMLVSQAPTVAVVQSCLFSSGAFQGLDADGLGRVCSSMLDALNWSIASEKRGYASNISDSTDIPLSAPFQSAREKNIIKLADEHYHFINNLPSYPGFEGRPTDLYCPCSDSLHQWLEKSSVTRSPSRHALAASPILPI